MTALRCDRRSSVSTSVVNRSTSSSMLPMAPLYSAGVRVSPSPTSPMPRMTESSVRSSCEASAVNRRNCSNDASSRAKVSLITAEHKDGENFPEWLRSRSSDRDTRTRTTRGPTVAAPVRVRQRRPPTASDSYRIIARQHLAGDEATGDAASTPAARTRKPSMGRPRRRRARIRASNSGTADGLTRESSAPKIQTEHTILNAIARAFRSTWPRRGLFSLTRKSVFRSSIPSNIPPW